MHHRVIRYRTSNLRLLHALYFRDGNHVQGDRKSMSTQYRSSQIYISRNTRRCLSMIAKAEGDESSADAVGERLLSEKLSSSYPALMALQKKIESVEEEMVEAVKGMQ